MTEFHQDIQTASHNRATGAGIETIDRFQSRRPAPKNRHKPLFR